MRYLTIFKYGVSDTVCSEHRTLRGAEKAAKECEKAGGDQHRIWEVRELQIQRGSRPTPKGGRTT